MAYQFSFINQFEHPNPAFFVEDIPDMEVIVGNQFHYSVNATGKNLTYSDMSPLFEIDEKTGVIRFTPEQEGDHHIWISVGDGDQERFEDFELTIKQ